MDFLNSVLQVKEIWIASSAFRSSKYETTETHIYLDITGVYIFYISIIIPWFMNSSNYNFHFLSVDKVIKNLETSHLVILILGFVILISIIQSTWKSFCIVFEKAPYSDLCVSYHCILLIRLHCHQYYIFLSLDKLLLFTWRWRKIHRPINCLNIMANLYWPRTYVTVYVLF